jgi:hypothetical protein
MNGDFPLLDFVKKVDILYGTFVLLAIIAKSCQMVVGVGVEICQVAARAESILNFSAVQPLADATTWQRVFMWSGDPEDN